jgi:NAD-dependent DNA ligase
MEIANTIKMYDLKKMLKFCQEEELSKLHSLKLYLDDFYYNTSKSIISDELYDVLKSLLTTRDPLYVPPIGAKIRSNQNKAKLPFYMGSLDKITPADQKELDRWLEKNKCNELVVSDKLDGVSGTFICKNGKKKLFTRGDGETGSDISYFIQYINNIPNIKNDITVKGELIIKKKIFNDKYDKNYKNARSMIVGLIGSKTIKLGLCDIQFIAYEIVGDETMERPYTQLNKLKSIGFTIPFFEKINTDTNTNTNMDKLVKLHNKMKEKSHYDIDGIVIQSNRKYDRNISGNPSYMFALKINSEDNIVSTKVLDIEWSVSAWGQIIPVAIVDPVKLQGITLERATVSNASLMKQKMIGPGSIVNVTRSKDVIPFIVSVEEKCEMLKYPNIEYEWDNNNVHIHIVNPTLKTISEMNVKLFSRFFEKMGIKHVSDRTVTKLYLAGFNTLLKIIKATHIDLITIAKFKEKSATRIYDNIKNGLKNVNVQNLLGSSGIFGIGIGRKKIVALMKDIPDILTANRKNLMKRILDVEGFSDITSKKVISNLDEAVKFIDQISEYVSFQTDTRISDALVGKKFCFSGFRSKDLEQQITDRGGQVVTSISKKTSGLIVSNYNENTTKVTKAISCAVKIYIKEDFIKSKCFI